MAQGKQSAQTAHTQDETARSLASASPSRKGIASITATIALGAGQPLTERHQQILENRGISADMAARMQLRSAPKDSTSIQIPFFRNGIEVNCKTRSIEGDKKFYQVEGAEKCFFNLMAITEAEAAGEPLVITEGEFDAIIALQCGYIAVSVPDGAPKEAIGDRDSKKYDYLADIPKTLKVIILATDNDAAGVNLMNDLALRLGRHRCKWIKYPKGCKDLNDAFIKYGAAGVRASIATAQYMAVDGLYRMDDLPPLIEQPSHSVGISKLADHFKLRRGDFSVVTGIPSHGKSTFVNNVCYNMAQKHGWNVTFASFEQPPQTEHRRALRTLCISKPEYEQTPQEKHTADQFINNHFSFIVPTEQLDEDFDLNWLLERMAAAVTRHNCDMIVIDPWNEIDHVYDQREESITQYVGRAIKQLKRFSRTYNVHVMVVAHPAKMKKDKDGIYPVPSAYDISDSAHWYNKPEQIIVVHRENYTDTLVRISKSRYHYALGTPADVTLWFNKDTGRYS